MLGADFGTSRYFGYSQIARRGKIRVRVRKRLRDHRFTNGFLWMVMVTPIVQILAAICLDVLPEKFEVGKPFNENGNHGFRTCAYLEDRALEFLFNTRSPWKFSPRHTRAILALTVPSTYLHQERHNRDKEAADFLIPMRRVVE